MKQNADDTHILNAIFDACADVIIVSDKHGRIARANCKAADLFGYKVDELVGQNLSILMPKDVAEQHDGYMRRHLETGERRVIGVGREVIGKKRDGTFVPINLNVGKAVIDGEPVFVGVLHDLSKRKHAEEALSRSQRLDAIGQMTGGIAHDFNNLLTIITGNLELLEMRLTNASERELVVDALQATELGVELTSRLIAFARQDMLAPEPLRLNDVCKNMLAILSRTLGEDVHIRTAFESDLPEVFVDRTQLMTAIMNLAMNAKDAMPDGGRLVFETSEAEIDDTYIVQETDILPGDYVRLSISDTGQGMSQEAQRRAFEPFFTTKGVGKGTGLGLSMVYGFVRQSGGYITLYSEAGQGTTVNIYFPTIEETGANDLVVHPENARLPTSGVDGGLLALVVDDNPSVLRLSVERMRSLGFDTIEAVDGDEALEILASRQDIALMFSDMIMPGELSGFALAKRVSEMYPDVKILLTSGYSEEVIRFDPADRNGFLLLRKPYRQHELVESIQALFEPP